MKDFSLRVKHFDPKKWNVSDEYEPAVVHVCSRGLLIELAGRP